MGLDTNPARSAESKKVLVVDDEEGIRRFCTDLLEAKGWSVYPAGSASEAFYLLERERFGVVLLDKNLNDGCTGIALLEHARTIMPHTKTIIMTGYPSTQSATDAVRLGAFDYLTKPVAAEKLLKCVEEASREFVRDYEQVAETKQHDSLFELIPGLVWFIDQQGIIQRINKRGAQALGYGVDELLGKHFTVVIADKNPSPSVTWSFLERRTDQRATTANVIPFYTKSGERRLYEVHALGGSLSTRGMPQIGSVGVGHDVTELIGIQQRLRRVDKTEALGHMVAEVVHEFNNIITIIRGGCELLEMQANLLPNSNEISLILNATKRADTLNRQLLSFAHDEPPERSQVALASVAVNLKEMLEQLLSSQYRLLIESKLAPNTWILGDRQQIGQIVMNLVINARDAMPGGGDVRLRLEQQELTTVRTSVHAKIPTGQYVTLSVSDTGTGMSPETLKNALEPFVTTKEEGHGTGIGLATVSRIVKQHNSHLEIQSEEGVGTTVSVWFPYPEKNA